MLQTKIIASQIPAYRQCDKCKLFSHSSNAICPHCNPAWFPWKESYIVAELNNYREQIKLINELLKTPYDSKGYYSLRKGIIKILKEHEMLEYGTQ